jgi:GDP-L-fucose synthase
MRKLLIAGSEGMLGTSLQKILTSEEQPEVFEVVKASRSLGHDLTKEKETKALFARVEPQVIIVCAAKVGGIQANIKDPVGFGIDNVAIAANVLKEAHEYGSQVVFIGSSCMYPREAPQPMVEDFVLAGKPEPTNEMYSIAKIFGAKLAESYHKQYGDLMGTCILPNLYGPNDCFDSDKSHVISATIKKMHTAKKSETAPIIWGTGTARREFMYVDDAARAVMFMVNNKISKMINMGTGKDFSIKELTDIVAEIVGYEGNYVYDTTKPDGMPRKLMDSSKASLLGFSPKVSLKDGIVETYARALSSGSLA